MRKFHITTVLLIIILLIGCVPGAIYLSISSNELGETAIIIKKASGACHIQEGGAVIQSIWIGEARSGNQYRTTWLLKSIDAQGVFISELGLGVVPNGFQEVVRYTPTILGMTYDAEFSGHGCKGGIVFSISNARQMKK